MPDKIIEIPNVGRIAFPDSMTPAQMDQAAAKLYAEKNPTHPKVDPAHSWVDTAVDWLPAAGGMAGGIVGGIGGTVLGAGVGGVPGALGGAALGGATGEAAKQLINRARGVAPPMTGTPLQAAAGAATNIAKEGAVQGVAEAAGAGVGTAMAHIAPRIMQSAVKPTLKMLGDVVKGAPVPRVVQTLLDEGVNVTPAGYRKLNDVINATKDQRDAMIYRATKMMPDAGVNPFAVTSRLKDTAETFSQQVNPASDLEAISAAGQKFLEEFGGDKLALEQANSIKEGTYAVLRKKYGQMGSADVEAQKALARGLKEEIEKQAPGVEPLNRRLGNASEAARAVGRRVGIASNRDSAGILWVAENPAAFLAGLMDRSPAVKSMLARGLYQSAGAASKVSPQLIRAAVAALASQDDSSPDRASQ